VGKVTLHKREEWGGDEKGVGGLAVLDVRGLKKSRGENSQPGMRTSDWLKFPVEKGSSTIDLSRPTQPLAGRHAERKG